MKKAIALVKAWDPRPIVAMSYPIFIAIMLCIAFIAQKNYLSALN
jgi:hypothetical protein